MKTKLRPVLVRLHPHTWRDIGRLARKNDISKGAQTRRVLEHGLATLPKQRP